MRVWEALPRFVFFTGKGGVGKTSLASATAVRLAAEGNRVLLVSTDPASNVGQVLGQAIGNTVTAVDGIPGLDALEIDPQDAADQFRSRVIDPVRGTLPASEIDAVTEQLSGACTTEIASFTEFAILLADREATAAYDHVVFDTAPTGHTIRLLQLPGEWTTYLADGKGDVSCLGPLAGLDSLRGDYASALASLTDPTKTRLVLVSRAHSTALGEAARTYGELRALGMTNAHLVVNGLLPDTAAPDPLETTLRAREQAALAGMPSVLGSLPRTDVTLRPFDIMGVAALRDLLDPGTNGAAPAAPQGDVALPDNAAGLGGLVDEIEAGGPCLVMTMGKGGVGKTTMAAAVAVALAQRGHDVLLTTTDPAAHLAETLQGDVPGLSLTRIDPKTAIDEYRDRVMATKGDRLDDEARAALVEDLKSPCTEEVAVFQQFSRTVFQSRRQFVVLDTAPTGHTLLLLDATGSYHRDITRQMTPGSRYTTPLMRLQDPLQTKVLLVTLPETTPVLEVTELQEDLVRAGITPYAWIVNASLAAARPTSDFLQARAHAEAAPLRQVETLTERLVVVPLLTHEPVGVSALAALTSRALTPTEREPSQVR